MRNSILALTPLLAALAGGCSSSSSSPVAPSYEVDDAAATSAGGSTGGGATTTASDGSLPPMYSHFYNGVEVFLSGSSVVIRADGLPDHASPYYGAGHSLYEAPHAAMVVNPNRIIAQDLEAQVPLAPQVNAAGSSTPLGTIGIAVNGVAIFNQYAGPNNAPLDNEIATFDRYNGHPQQSGVYHYHWEPLWLTSGDRAALVGVLADGFPVYGPIDLDGSTPTDLDACNGHVGVTADHPDGIYHYHTTAAFPYISGCFRGSAGAISG